MDEYAFAVFQAFLAANVECRDEHQGSRSSLRNLVEVVVVVFEAFLPAAAVAPLKSHQHPPATAGLEAV